MTDLPKMTSSVTADDYRGATAFLIKFAIQQMNALLAGLEGPPVDHEAVDSELAFAILTLDSARDAARLHQGVADCRGSG